MCLCHEIKCHVCSRVLDPGARNLDVDGGWVMIPASASKFWEHERVAACLAHDGVKETILRLSGFYDLERALDAWNNREVETAVVLAAEFEIRVKGT